MLSDYLDHNANAVHVFTYHMLQSLKILLPQMYCFIACVLHIFSSRYCLLSQVYCVLSHQGIAFVIVIIFLIALLLFNGFSSSCMFIFYIVFSFSVYLLQMFVVCGIYLTDKKDPKTYPKTLKYWVGVQQCQSYLMRRRCLFSLAWPPF